MTLLILYAALAIGVSFLCSLLEAALLSLPRSYVESLVERGAWAGPVMRRMKENIDRPLAGILTLNTVAHTVGAAGVGAQAAVVFGSRSVGVVSAVMTLAILVFSEIVPKTLGAVHARLLAAPTALLIRVIIVVSYPIILPLEGINRLLRFRQDGDDQDRLSRAELLATIRLGQSAGTVRTQEYRIATNLLALSDMRLTDVLTPRTVVFSLPRHMTAQEVLESYNPIAFARIPLYDTDPEQAAEYVRRYAIHAAVSDGRGDTPLAELAVPLPIVAELMSVADALERFVQERWHIARVVDEYGGMAGVVSLEDLLETLLGEEIVDETDPVTDMQELARRRFRQRQSGRGSA